MLAIWVTVLPKSGKMQKMGIRREERALYSADDCPERWKGVDLTTTVSVLYFSSLLFTD